MKHNRLIYIQTEALLFSHLMHSANIDLNLIEVSII